MTTSIQTHQRVNETILRPYERRALDWFAPRMPAWVTPDHLTALGMFSAMIIAVSLVLTNLNPNFLWLACVGIVGNWFGDSLDGTLARYRKTERSNYGYFIDHSVDSVCIVLVFLALGLSPYVNMELAGLALVAYLLMSVHVFLYTEVKGVFQISFMRLGPTEMRVIMVLANILVYFVGNPQWKSPVGIYTLYDCVLVVVALLLFIVFVVMTIQRSRELAAFDEHLLELKAQRAVRKAEKAERRAERAAAKTAQRLRKARGRNPDMVGQENANQP